MYPPEGKYFLVKLESKFIHQTYIILPSLNVLDSLTLYSIPTLLTEFSLPLQHSTIQAMWSLPSVSIDPIA